MNELVNQLRALSDNGGSSFVGLFATAIVVGWRVYSLPVLQSRIPEKYRWATLSATVQWSIMLGGAALSGVLTAVSTGKSGWELVAAALHGIKDILLK